MVEEGIDLSIRVSAVLNEFNARSRGASVCFRQQLFAVAQITCRAGTPEDPDDIRAHRVAGFLMADHLLQWELAGPDGHRTILSVDPAVRVGNSLILRDLLIAGYGIGALADFVSATPEASGALVRVLPDYQLPPR
jgi:DNA-binding transcriptional LysR family regulator